MKIIFLDVDGVLNTTNTFIKRKIIKQKTGYYILEIDDFRLQYLKEIVDKSNSKIVLTSTWRMNFKKENNKIIPLTNKAKELQNKFKEYGIDIYDITILDKNRNREKEIKEWLNNNNVENFVILDDDNKDLQSFIDKELIHIKNNPKDLNEQNNGLCIEHIEKALQILCPFQKKYK